MNQLSINVEKGHKVHMYVQCFSTSSQIWEDLLKFDTTVIIEVSAVQALEVNWELIDACLKQFTPLSMNYILCKLYGWELIHSDCTFAINKLDQTWHRILYITQT